MSCDCGHMSLHHPRNKEKRKRKIKLKKLDKRKRKYQSLSILLYILEEILKT